MKFTIEKDLRSFDFWSGAKDNAHMLTLEELDILDDLLIDVFGDEVTDTDINDLFWFNFDEVCQLLGYIYDSKTGEVMRGEKE